MDAKYCYFRSRAGQTNCSTNAHSERQTRERRGFYGTKREKKKKTKYDTKIENFRSSTRNYREFLNGKTRFIKIIDFFFFAYIFLWVWVLTKTLWNFSNCIECFKLLLLNQNFSYRVLWVMSPQISLRAIKLCVPQILLIILLLIRSVKIVLHLFITLTKMRCHSDVDFWNVRDGFYKY